MFNFDVKSYLEKLKAKQPQPGQISYMPLAQSMTGANPVFQPNTPTLPANYGFNDLAAYEEARRKALGEQFQQQIGQAKTGIESTYNTALKGYQDTTARRRADLATSLSENAKKNFALQNPAILEDLNARGVFSSPTAVSQAQAQALKELESGNQSTLLNFDTSSRAYEDALAQKRLQDLNELSLAGTSANIQSQQDALDAALNLRRGNLEANIAGANASREEALARDLAEQSKKAGITQSLIGAGGGILGGLLPSLIGGGKAGGIGSLFGKTAATTASSSAIGPGSFPVAPAAGGIGSAIPLAALGVGGVLGYKALPDSGLISKSTIAPLVNPIKTVSSIGKSLKKSFCFDPRTPVIMADGTEKEIQKVNLGDETKGGTVVSIRVSLTDDGTLFNRLGTLVTGSHAVQENGAWIRVEDSAYSIPVAGATIVVSLVTTDHRIYVGDTVFADELETDEYEYLDMDESLAKMNQDDGLVGVN